MARKRPDVKTSEQPKNHHVWVPPEGWAHYGRRLAMKVGAVRMDLMRTDDLDRQYADIDWYALAIARLGGAQPAAKLLKVSRSTVYDWYAKGLSTMSLGVAVELARLSDVPLGVLAKRLGPPMCPEELKARSPRNNKK